MTDESANLPAWVRRRDGSRAPFDADRVGQSLYAASESLGEASAFLIRELTDVVMHFLARRLDGMPTTAQIAEQVEIIVREVGQPALARRYAELQSAVSEPMPRTVVIGCEGSPEAFARHCWKTYAVERIYARDVVAACREGLLHIDGSTPPGSLTTLVLDTTRLAEVDWWLALDDWRTCGGETWVVESPEWLCSGRAHPSLTPHLCDRLLSLPILAQREVELHLNIAGPPAWSLTHPARPLFAVDEDDGYFLERANFLDGLIERWKLLDTTRMPAIAWHLHERSFRDDTEQRQLDDMIRLAIKGRPIRFIFDRLDSATLLSDGLDRRCPGVLVKVGVDLASLARRPDVGQTLLKKLPSLARMAVSAAAQKRNFLRSLPATSPLKNQFLIERSTAVVAPINIEQAARLLDADSMIMTARIVQILRESLQDAGRSINLDVRLDGEQLPAVDSAASPERQMDMAAMLHAHAGAGTATLCFSEATRSIQELLKSAWASTPIARLRLQRTDAALEQGEFPIS